ncbi:MAG: winged helix-turn-helix transcriptional regulator [Myxococcales bacterium]|nr:winged helix-turn-helix transcriptional regulator [Myxococcales bacterium]
MSSSARSDQLFDQLRARIVSGAFAAGTRLPPERQLAEALDANRSTLREALRRLEQARLIHVRQGQGATVRDFRRDGTIDLLAAYFEHAPPEDAAAALVDLLAPRTALLRLLLPLAAERRSAADLDALRRAAATVRRAEASSDRAEAGLAQAVWLGALLDATHNVPARWIANPLIDAVAELVARYPALVLLEPSFGDMAGEVTRALAARDHAAALSELSAFYDAVDRRLVQLAAAARAARAGTARAAGVGDETLSKELRP